MASDDDKNFADAWTLAWTRLLPWAFAIWLICFGIYSCGETLIAPKNNIYFGKLLSASLLPERQP